MKNIYIDIDGTLTNQPEQRWGIPYLKRIKKVQQLCKQNKVVIWSGGGYEYAKKFCKLYNISPFTILSKPDYFVDDNKNIRNKLQYIEPEEIFKL